MAGFRILGTFDGKTNYATMPLPVASGVTITAGDLVYFSSGRVTSASIAGARCIGVALETATGNSGGSVKALVAIEPNLKLLAKNDNVVTTFAASHVGQYFDVTGATGAQLVDTSQVSTTTGQLLCLEYNPQIDPYKLDTTYGVFIVAEHASHLGI